MRCIPRDAGLLILGALSFCISLGCGSAPNSSDNPLTSVGGGAGSTDPGTDVAGVVEEAGGGEDLADGGDATGDGGLVGEEPAVDDPATDPEEPPVPEMRFRVDAVSGPRPIELTVQAVYGNGLPLPDGTYTWSVNEYEDSGPAATHGRRSGTLSGGGSHVVTLRYTPPDGSEEIVCRNTQSGTTQYVVTVWPQISGRVAAPSGQGVADVHIMANEAGGTATTGPYGNYKVEVPFDWTGQVQCVSDQYEFAVSTRSYARVQTDVSEQDFRVVAGRVKVSGCVLTHDGAPIAGYEVAMEGTDASALTDTEGYYELSVPLGGSGKLVPEAGKYAFDPPRRPYVDLCSNVYDADFTAGAFTLDEAVEMFRTLPSYNGGPRVVVQSNGSYWAADGLGKEVLAEIVRCGGAILANVTSGPTGPATGKLRMGIELAQEGVPLWLEMNTLGGLGATAPIESLDPNYLHDTTAPLETYYNPEHAPSGKTESRLMFCPGRRACRRQIAGWFEAGRNLRAAGVHPDMVAGIFSHCETAYVARTSGYRFDPLLYDDCRSCGSPEEHNRKLGELHADIMHAFLRGLGAMPAGDLNRDGVEDDEDALLFLQAVLSQDPIGDYNNDGRVDDADQTFLSGLPAAEVTAIPRFWWNGGYHGGAEEFVPSPWLPIETHSGVPVQTYANFSNYDTDAGAVQRLADCADYNVSVLGLPAVPFLSLVYDGSALRDWGVDPALNRQKAEAARAHGCPMIWCYALNPPTQYWVTPEIFQKQFDSLKAIIEGSRP